MKLRHILAGLLGLFLLTIWGLVAMGVSFIFTGRFFNDD